MFSFKKYHPTKVEFGSTIIPWTYLRDNYPKIVSLDRILIGVDKITPEFTTYIKRFVDTTELQSDLILVCSKMKESLLQSLQTLSLTFNFVFIIGDLEKGWYGHFYSLKHNYAGQELRLLRRSANFDESGFKNIFDTFSKLGLKQITIFLEGQHVFIDHDKMGTTAQRGLGPGVTTHFTVRTAKYTGSNGIIHPSKGKHDVNKCQCDMCLSMHHQSYGLQKINNSYKTYLKEIIKNGVSRDKHYQAIRAFKTGFATGPISDTLQIASWNIHEAKWSDSKPWSGDLTVFDIADWVKNFWMDKTYIGIDEYIPHN